MSHEALTPLQRAFLALEKTRAKLDSLERAKREPIAVVGIGCRTPGDGDDAAALWELLRSGRDAVGPVPADRWDRERAYSPDPDAPGRTMARDGGFLSRVDGFDAELFGISPREAQGMDPQQRLVLEVAWEALENAAIAPDRLQTSRTGVYLGIASNDYLHLLLHAGDPRLLDAHFMSGIAHSIASGRLSYLLGLQGPSLSIDTACSSSLVAVHLACQALRSGECDAALAGGVNVILSPDISVAYSRSRLLSPDGRCKTFDASADGIARGEGCGIVVLRRLSDALASGDRILALIRGSAVNQDGPSSGLTAPNGPAQEAVIRAALESAGVEPGAVGYVEAHGTGTPLGDPLEMQALGAVFGGEPRGDRPLYVGSLKTNFGHLEAAAGVVGLIKVVLSMTHREIPPHLHFHTPSPHIPWDELPITIPTDPTPWPETEGTRMGGVSSFGFSGTNTHIVLEQAPVREIPTAALDRPLHLLTLSAQNDDALREQARRLSVSIADRTDDELGDVAYTLNVGRASLPERAAFTAATVAEARARLDAIAEGAPDDDVGRTRVVPGVRPRVAFLFTGQGAQYVGMGRGLYESSPVFRAALDECAALLDPLLPRPLLEVMYSSDATETELDQTGFAQPALFALEYALAALWRIWGVEPAAVLGHSVGEVTAACIAGVLSLADAARLIAARGRHMQALPAGGGMRVVFASAAQTETLLAEVGGPLEIAGINGPAQTVVSGPLAALDQFGESLESAGVKSKALKVSHAFHSALMEPALEPFRRDLAELRFDAPRLRLISNLTGGTADAEAIRTVEYWSEHIRRPVRFAPGMETLAELRCDAMLEIGPAPTLITLGRDCIGADAAAWCASLRSGRDDWEQILGALRTLYLLGVPIDWAAFDQDYARSRLSLPTYPFQRRRIWFQTHPGAGAHREGDDGDHPLLGRRVPSPLPERQFEAWLSAESPAFIGDHVAGGVVLLPGMASIEIGLAAARDLFGEGRHAVEDLVLREAMIFDPERALRVQTIVAPREGDTAAFRVQSIAEGADAWTFHTEGRIRIGSKSTTLVDDDPLTAVRARCDQPMEVEALYEAQRRQGYDFGPRLHGVVEVRRGEGEAFGEIVLPAAEDAEAVRYDIHPALLDACMQVLGGALPRAEGGADAAAGADAAGEPLYLPVMVRRFSLLRPPGTRCVSHVRLEAGSRRGMPVYSAVVRIFDPDSGQLIGAMEGLRLQRVSSDALKRLAGRTGREELLHQVRWVPQPLDLDEEALDTRGIAHRAGAHLETLADEYGLSEVDDFIQRVEVLAGRWTERTLADLGWGASGQEWESADAIADRLGIVAAHRRLFDRLLRIYAEEGGARERDGLWTVLREPERLDVEREFAELKRSHPDAAELQMLGATGPRLVEALRGECDPLQLLFPGGSTETAERLYTDSPLAHLYNTMMADAFEAILRSAPAGRPLRVLEVGGGTGGTTSYLLQRVRGYDIDYVFTDLGDSFVIHARRKFAAHDFMHSQVLDIERDPVSQGVAEGSVDVVIASNVLHATSDIRRTLSHVRRMLSKSGTLLLLEITTPERWFDLTVGLTEGWWKFADVELRPSYTTLRAEQWRTVLEEAGLDCSTAVPADTTSWSLARQQIFVAQDAAVSRTASQPRAWAVVADKGGIGSGLAAALRARGDRCVTLASPDADAGGAEVRDVAEKPHRDLVPLGPGPAIEAHGAALRVCRERFGPEFGIIDLRWLDVPLWDDRVNVEGALKPAVTNSLALTQATLDECSDAPPRTWIVTRGAQAAGGVDAPLSPFQGAACGLGRTLALEHPELRPVRIDLDSSVDAEEAAMLVAELGADGSEGEVAFRGAERLVSRLVRREPPERRDIPVDNEDNYRLLTRERGTLDRLERVGCDRPEPGQGEVEVQVGATGLNFRDVLNVLGMYPGDPGPPGAECAGRVTRLGPGVEGLAVGERVVATGPACFSRFVVTRSETVQRVPDGMTFAEAAGIPIAYLTAAYTLMEVGRLSAGERVLIHAAAGGVGLAAVYLALRTGAEVFATAGSPQKRAYLRGLGVRHIFDSRQTTFGAEILAGTDGVGVDVVLNSLSGNAIEESLRATRTGGRFLEIGKRDIWSPEQVAALGRDLSYHVLDVGAIGAADPATMGRVFSELMDEVRAGVLPPLPVTPFALTDSVEAFRYMMQARHIGKIVVVHESELDRLSDGAGRGPRDGILVRADGTYLITGGLSGLGLLVARWLVERGARHLVLMSRRGVTAEAEPVLADLRAAGATVRAEALDISDEGALSALLEDVRARGPSLCGVVHAAGVLDDGVLLSQDWSRFAHVFAPKVVGGRLLDRMTRPDPLDWFLLFSSAASMIGSPGQANHAAANALLDVLAHERRRLGRSALSINWGPWAEVGVAADRSVQARLATQGLRALSPEEGLALLEDLIAGGDVQAGAMAVDWKQWGYHRGPQIASYLSETDVPSRSTTPATAPEPSRGAPTLRTLLDANPKVRWPVVIAGFVRAAARRVLGLPETAALDDRVPLSEVGLDSLLAVELRNALGKETGTGLPATLLFDYPTVEALAGYLTLLEGEGGAETEDRSQPAAAQIDEADDLLSAIEALTEEQADRLTTEDPQK